MFYQDKTLTCIDCGAEFVFTAGEQEFHASKGFTSEPRRCLACRRARKAAQGDGGAQTNAGSNEARPQRQLFDVVCASCGKTTQVPFQPTGNRPVYCSDCFRSQKGSAPRSGNRGGGNRNENHFSAPRERSSFSFTERFDSGSFGDEFSMPPAGNGRRNKRDRRDRRDKEREERDYNW